MGVQIFSTELRIVITLLVMFLLPGWVMLAVSGLWRCWEGLQRWIVALGLGIALYPVLFYFTRWVAPFLTFGPYKLLALLALCAGIIAWNLRHDWRAQFDFAPAEWVALGVVGLTLLTRYWILRDHPYPAWTDSLHHTLLTQLTAINGQLPATLEPYAPISLDQYHLGLYALTAAVQWLARVPAYTALLWTAQFLNGICGVGVYLLLDRYAERRAALIGAVVAGLLGQHPAFYFNWGRFTQVAAQAITLIAWAVTLDALESALRDEPLPLWKLLLAASLSGGVFFLHFRVAIFYGVLVLVGMIRLGLRAWKTRRFKSWATATGILGLGTLLVISPILWRAVVWRVTRIVTTVATTQSAARQAAQEPYFATTWANVDYLVAPRWLIVVAVMAAFVVILGRSRAIDQVLWAAFLPLLGMAYQLGIPWLNITNLSGILIMYYLPIALVIGDAGGWLADRFRLPRGVNNGLLLLTTLFCLNGAYARATDVESYRYFLTPEDVTAMAWIRENTPTDAVFAVNTHFWLPRAPHGADGGYWIPYFAERRTTAGVMLNNLGSAAYQETIVQGSQQVKRLEVGDAAALSDLRALGITHIYVGARPHFAGAGLSQATLLSMVGTTLVYDQGGVAIFAIQ